MKDVDISVNLCTLNRAKLLQGVLESLTDQETFEKFSYEVIVVDNGSIDETECVVRGAASASRVPVRYFREEARGIPQARNRGIKESRGEWIAFFDDDQLATDIGSMNC